MALPQRMIELLQDRRVLHPLVRLAASLDVEAIGIALEDSLRALHGVDAAVRPRQVGAVLDDDRPAQRRLDQAGVDVAERERSRRSGASAGKCSRAQSCSPRDGLLIETR